MLSTARALHHSASRNFRRAGDSVAAAGIGGCTGPGILTGTDDGDNRGPQLLHAGGLGNAAGAPLGTADHHGAAAHTAATTPSSAAISRILPGHLVPLRDAHRGTALAADLRIAAVHICPDPTDSFSTVVVANSGPGAQFHCTNLLHDDTAGVHTADADDGCCCRS